MATLLPEGKQSFTDGAGMPLVGGKLYTYDAGTSTPRPTYSDAAGTIPNTNPVVLDARGEATIFWSGTYKVVLKDALDNVIWSVDGMLDNGLALRDELFTTAGAEHVGVDDGASGSLWTTVAGFIQRVLSAAGSSVVGFIQSGVGAVARTMQDKGRDSVAAFDFMTSSQRAAVVAGTAAAGIADAVNAALAAHTRVKLNPGTYDDAGGASIVVPAGKVLDSDSYFATTIRASQGNVALKLLGSFSQAHRITVIKTGVHAANLVEIGSIATRSDRAHISNLYVQGAGNDGIQIINGNLGTIENIRSIGNGRDGINFTTDTADNNTWTMQGFIDTLNNTRDGVHFAGSTSVSNAANSRSHAALLICAQTNGRYGVYSNARSNVLTVYGELNGARDVYLDALAYGSHITLVEGNFTDVSVGSTIITANSAADYVRSFKQKVFMAGGVDKGLRIQGDDGTAGYADLEKTAGRELRLKMQGSAGQWNLYIENTSSGQEVISRFGGRVFPTTDNTRTLGDAALRWSVVYAGTGTINTSDEREKQQVRSLTDAERAVAVRLKSMIRAFKFNDAVMSKGDAARIHFGVMAQAVKAAFEAEGLVAEDYALLCFDRWAAEIDYGGNEIRPAGERYGVRYEEMLAFIISAL